MVDALRAAHRAVKRGGVVIDARPDASRAPRVSARGAVRGCFVQTADADQRDAQADSAVEHAISEGLFRPVRRGHLWYATTYRDLAELEAYLAESGRYDACSRGTRKALLPFRRRPILVRRAIKFQVLERL